MRGSQEGAVECPGATINDHKLGASNNRNRFSHSLEAGSLKLRCQQDRAPSKGLREDPPCLFQLLAAPGVPWPMAISLQPLPVSLRRHMAFHSSLCLSSYKEPVTGLGPILI